MQREVHLFGLPVIRVVKMEFCEKRYFLGIQYRVKKYAQRYDSFAAAFAANVHGVRDRRIKVIINNTGEAVTYARTHALWYKPDELVFGSRFQHADIFRLFAPHIPVFYCGDAAELKERQCIDGNDVEPLLTSSRLLAMNNRGKPFLQSWAEYMHVDVSSLSYSRAVIPPEVERSALAKAQALRLNLDNFVFFSPVARSCEALPSAFWDEIETSLRARGYDVFYNSPLFSISEAYALASHAKAIVALRSGLCDVLCDLQVPQFIIYSHNKFHGDLQPMYSLKLFPWVTKEFIHEYNVFKQDVNIIQEDILAYTSTKGIHKTKN